MGIGEQECQGRWNVFKREAQERQETMRKHFPCTILWLTVRIQILCVLCEELTCQDFFLKGSNSTLHSVSLQCTVSLEYFQHYFFWLNPSPWHTDGAVVLSYPTKSSKHSSETTKEAFIRKVEILDLYPCWDTCEKYSAAKRPLFVLHTYVGKSWHHVGNWGRTHYY